MYSYLYTVLIVKLPKLKFVISSTIKEFIKNQEPSPTGVIFREEVIKEENSSDRKVLDVMKYAKKDGTNQASLQPRRTEKKSTDTLDSSSCATARQGTNNDIFFDKS